jgi:cytochrome c-type biogenesis protein CcmF
MYLAIGHFALNLALCLTLAGIGAALAALRGSPGWARSARQSVFLVFITLSISIGILEYAFLSHDYALDYVAAHSSNDLPLFYLATALWGGHEGSLLLWVWILSLYAAVAAWRHWSTHPRTMPYLLLISQAVMAGFLCLVSFLSNPFTMASERLPDGAGLNPLLQDPGMVFHPPFLYMGYVGFTIPFAFAMAALLSGRADAEWIKATRRWTLFSWLMLTFGIAMGGYWAYYELGWGGYWAWDPVENASFMPWLTGTAFLHSVMVQETRRMFKVWNVFLIIMTFALSLLGTFLVRSGVLSSVHSFAADPSRGMYILLFMTAVLVLSFGALILRASKLSAESRLDSLLSRESAFLYNNLFFLVATATVFAGTLYPLALEAFTGGKVTVGAPYYNTVFTPVMLAMTALMGIGPLIPWRTVSLQRFRREMLTPVLGAVIGVVVSVLAGIHAVYPLVGLGLAYFVALSIVVDLLSAARALRKRDGCGWLPSLPLAIWGNKRRFGGQIVHAGVVLVILGLIGSNAFKEEKELMLKPGDSFQLGPYQVRFDGVKEHRGANYDAITGRFVVLDGGRELVMNPERRQYRNSRMPTTEAAINDNWWRDVYLALGNEADGAWAVKAFLNPLVKWLWAGIVVMGLGTLLAMSHGRRKEGKA